VSISKKIGASMPLNPISTSFSVPDLQRKYREVIDAAKDSKDAVVLNNNSRPEAVVIDVDTYDELIKDLYPYNEAYTKKVVERSRASLKKGRGKKLKFWDELDG
jgi:prevent-host-death family protein